MKMDEAKRVLARGMRLRCPACGETKLFQSFLKMRKACSYCGLVYEREQGFFIGAIYINVITTNILILAVYLASLAIFAGLRDSVYWVMMGVGVVYPLLFFRWSRSLWLSLNFIVSPPHRR
ncbi:MAG TPA: DUF983 domain-containing protein [Pyrinomonadaceae bacterium]|jgi:uncharacterized protein (DUF983 family)